MSSKSEIEWTNATWNPTVGCKRVSPGCDHCYAFQLHDQRHVAWKQGRWESAPIQYHKPFSAVQLLRERVRDPLSWMKPRRIFVNSMSDLFHEAVPDEFLLDVFMTMAFAPQHTFQILTKRPERMRQFLKRAMLPFPWECSVEEALRMAYESAPYPLPPWVWPLPNVWLGVSVENPDTAEERLPLLEDVPAAVRFVSLEPLLEDVDIWPWLKCYHDSSTGTGEDDVFECDTCHEVRRHVEDPEGDVWEYSGDGRKTRIRYETIKPGRMLDWVIVGGESGPRFRPLNLDWARSVRDQCVAAGVPFFFKQVGGRTPKAGGNLLDGQVWQQFPGAVQEAEVRS